MDDRFDLGLISLFHITIMHRLSIFFGFDLHPGYFKQLLLKNRCNASNLFFQFITLSKSMNATKWILDFKTVAAGIIDSRKTYPLFHIFLISSADDRHSLISCQPAQQLFRFLRKNRILWP